MIKLNHPIGICNVNARGFMSAKLPSWQVPSRIPDEIVQQTMQQEPGMSPVATKGRLF